MLSRGVEDGVAPGEQPDQLDQPEHVELVKETFYTLGDVVVVVLIEGYGHVI